MCMKNDARIQKYKESLKIAWAYTDYNDWPIKFNSIMHLFADKFTEEFLRDFDDIYQKNISMTKVAEEFGYPARIYRILNTIIYGMKRKHMDLCMQREYLIKLLDIVKCLKAGSEFNENGENIILSVKNLTNIIKKQKFSSATRQDSISIHKFCGIMWAYTESICFRAHDLTKEIHGPYNIDGLIDNLIVREYVNLDVDELWEEIRLLPFHKIAIYTVYNNNVKLRIDAYDHLYIQGGNYNDDLLQYRIEIDGVVSSVEQLNELIPQMISTITAIHEWADRAEWKSIARKYAEIYWYRKKPLTDLLNKDWRLTKDVIRGIEEGKVNQKFMRCMSEREIDFLISTII